jgi:hypothetical protein
MGISKLKELSSYRTWFLHRNIFKVKCKFYNIVKFSNDLNIATVEEKEKLNQINFLLEDIYTNRKNNYLKLKEEFLKQKENA